MGKNKFINPVEKARRKAKQKEAKKQKKQREDARSLNLKSKNANQIILDLQRLDQIEFNVEDETPKLNEKVIASKRRKLKETWYRMLGAFKKDDQSKYIELKRIEMDYEAKRVRLIKEYEAVKSAKEVDLEQIPLPTNTNDNLNDKNNEKINFINLQPPKLLTIKGEIIDELKPPGCPAYVPPSLDTLEEELKIKKDTNADLDEFLKEVDQVEQMSKEIGQKSTNSIDNKESINKLMTPINLPPPPKSIIASLSNSINPAPFPVLYNPTAMGLINPHGIKKPPPPNLQNTLKPPTLNKQFQNQPIKNQPKSESEKPTIAATVIEAKPQLRNLSADLTKFLPTSLRIKRSQPATSNRKIISGSNQGFQPRHITNSATMAKPNKPVDNQANKDAAYEEFMKELNGLI